MFWPKANKNNQIRIQSEKNQSQQLNAFFYIKYGVTSLALKNMSYVKTPPVPLSFLGCAGLIKDTTVS